MLTQTTKRSFVTLALLIVSLILSACQITLLDPAMAEQNDSAVSTVNLHLFGQSDVDVMGATSTLERSTDGVKLDIDTVELIPGDAYTIWWVVFNNPAACADATCKGSDLSNPETQGMVGYAAGAIADEKGMAQFSSELAIGDNSIALDNNSGFPFELVEPAPGLVDVMTAEIHAVVRTHGAALDDPTIQLTSFGGGCNPECSNLQAALHLP